ncbi:MAG: UDP-N-acetylmuramoyl-L-alanyl-D-glutamate--2,6-diaminopimelate ligase [Nitrospirae bacterium]|nr:MAG: UDP-N-acetylmuramoyl-L-alanyl-D-glutamate--2,6-diaminopimelate ligase [Nitrospirota bacterium]
MILADLVESLEVIHREGNLDQEVKHVTDDSRHVQPGSLFVAVKGTQADGHAFVDAAIDRGAVAVVVEEVPQGAHLTRQGKERLKKNPVAVIQVKNSRRALGKLASRFFQDPSRKLTLIGVTGTNGKTTVTHLCKALLDRHGKSVGLIGTVGHLLPNSTRLPAAHTTPDPVMLQGLLARMVACNTDVAVMEVSSHALALNRVAGCEFDIVVYTNLTQDHLDFHRTMEEYFHAKLRLFTDCVAERAKRGPKRAIVNLDDVWGAHIVQKSLVPVWTYSLYREADLQAQGIDLSLEGTRFTALTPCGPIAVTSPLVGEHNVSNVLAAIGVGLHMGLSPETIRQGIALFDCVPGRFEFVRAGQDFALVVDYAHTEDALTRLLMTARKLGHGRLLTVFGCGGDRDRGKRPKMGAAAAQHSDLVFLTSDNPRSEDPMAILHDIEQGIVQVPKEVRAPYHVIPDRAEAIAAAVQEARPGDLVVIAGKGHEDYQIMGNQRLPFDDRIVAREAVLRLGKGAKLTCR